MKKYTTYLILTFTYAYLFIYYYYASLCLCARVCARVLGRRRIFTYIYTRRYIGIDIDSYESS